MSQCHSPNMTYLLKIFLVISVGDCIVAVNGVSTVNVEHQDAVEALKAAGGVVTLVILFQCTVYSC